MSLHSFHSPFNSVYLDSILIISIFFLYKMSLSRSVWVETFAQFSWVSFETFLPLSFVSLLWSDWDCFLLMWFRFGVRGRLVGQLQRPVGVAILSNGNIAIADYDNKWISIFDPTGKFMSRIGHGKLLGNSKYTLHRPSSPAISSTEKLMKRAMVEQVQKWSPWMPAASSTSSTTRPPLSSFFNPMENLCTSLGVVGMMRDNLLDRISLPSTARGTSSSLTFTTIASRWVEFRVKTKLRDSSLRFHLEIPDFVSYHYHTLPSSRFLIPREIIFTVLGQMEKGMGSSMPLLVSPLTKTITF